MRMINCVNCGEETEGSPAGLCGPCELERRERKRGERQQQVTRLIAQYRDMRDGIINQRGRRSWPQTSYDVGFRDGFRYAVMEALGVEGRLFDADKVELLVQMRQQGVNDETDES